MLDEDVVSHSHNSSFSNCTFVSITSGNEIKLLYRQTRGSYIHIYVKYIRNVHICIKTNTFMFNDYISTGRENEITN